MTILLRKLLNVRAVALVVALTACASTPPIRSEDGVPMATGVASLEWIELGGVEQAVLLRGQRRDNPVLLFLHGGPGATEMPMVRTYLEPLERDFVVVTWDMRGQGRSAARAVPPGTMTHHQMQRDAIQLIETLRGRFGVDKVTLVAHSWGTIVGARIAAQRPDVVHAYVGVGQWTDGVRREAESYRLLLRWARDAGNAEAERELASIGPPPWSGPRAAANFETQKRWLLESGGMVHDERGAGLLVAPLMLASEYSVLDKLQFMSAFLRTMNAMWPEAMSIDITSTVRRFDVPVYFVSGAHDMNTPPHLVESYVKTIEAPTKAHLVFERSAHAPCFEEPERFMAFLRRVGAKAPGAGA